MTRLQLPPGEGDHHRRGRHGHDRQRRAGRARCGPSAPTASGGARHGEDPMRGGWHYEIDSLGFNYRITDFQCALGEHQLGRLDEFIVARNGVAERYRELLDDVEGLALPAPAAGGRTPRLPPVRRALRGGRRPAPRRLRPPPRAAASACSCTTSRSRSTGSTARSATRWRGSTPPRPTTSRPCRCRCSPRWPARTSRGSCASCVTRWTHPSGRPWPAGGTLRRRSGKERRT